MQTKKLYPNLVDATSTIIKQFGHGIVHEERFVNILSDLNPDRDNPALFRIIKASIQDDHLKMVLSANANNIEHQIATASSILAKQYGYDQTLVENILFSLAVGFGTISVKEFNTINNPKPKPAPTKPKPNKQKIKPAPPLTQEFSIKDMAILLWGMLGLLVSPIFYAYQISANEWWPMGASIVVAFIHIITIFPVSISFDDNTSVNSRRVHSALHGGYCALYLFAILYWIAFPLFWSFEKVQAYWGFLPNKEAFPWILTWGVNLFCALFLSVGLGQGVSSFSNNWRQNKGKFQDNLQDLMTEQPYRNGFFTVSAFFVLAAFVLFSIPIVRESQYKKQIEEYNNKIEALNHHSDSIRNARSQTERNLSFAQFKLGDSFSSCVSKIKNEDNYSIFKDRGIDQLEMNEKDYINIVDSIIELRTDWNNEIITLYMYFSNQRLVAIEFSPEKTNSDSLLSVYTSKYGEPESYRYKYVPSEYEGSKSDYYSIAYSIMDDKLVPDQYYWTYKNSILRIDYRKGDYSYKHGHYNDAANIIYFDRAIETFLQKHNEERTRKAREYEKRRKDSLRLVREAEERQQQEQRRQEELNHKRSMEQI